MDCAMAKISRSGCERKNEPFEGGVFIHHAVNDGLHRCGYTTAISAELYDGKSGKSGKAPAKDGATSGGTKTVGDTGTVAKDSPAGTPATPDGWSQYQRNGLTDAN